jgi:hypothetical protein
VAIAVPHDTMTVFAIGAEPPYVFREKRFENAFPGNLRFGAKCGAPNI